MYGVILAPFLSRLKGKTIQDVFGVRVAIKLMWGSFETAG
jgi:hypothetical protein